MVALLIRILTIGALVLTPVKAPPEILPSSLGPLKLHSWLEGDQALMSINKLHGRRIPMAAGYVAEYRGHIGDFPSKATLWIAQADDEMGAQDLLARMVRGLKNGNPSFGHYRSWSYGERTVHEVFGNGQKHLVFRNSHLVVWLAVDPHVPRPAMEEALMIGQQPSA
jgi:hypothetical protein